MVKSKINGTLDYVEEVTYGTIPTNPTLVWIGSVYSAKPVVNCNVVSKQKLPATTITGNKAFDFVHIPTTQQIGMDIGYVPQTGSFLDFFVYAVGGTTAAPVSDTQKSISLVLQDANAATLKWNVFKGMVCTDYTFDAPTDGAIDCKATFKGNELAAPSGTDPKGSGSHPSASTGAELTIKDITTPQMKYSADVSFANCTDALESLSFKVANKITFAPDIANTTSTKIGGYCVNKREITLDLTLDYYALENATPTGLSIADVRSAKSFDFQFTFDGKTYTFSGVRFPKLEDWEYGPDDKIGGKASSLPITGLAIA